MVAIALSRRVAVTPFGPQLEAMTSTAITAADAVTVRSGAIHPV
ncbi:MAG: hypothetical protein ACLP01_06710 [Solirubrobacteraceae bacterium]